ncbi:hypothetical protein [Terriglobus albidus]|uniref:hypothetical protein n=1 Tax=Terriglobus albidus TaxID=1592106 RepID=UPI0021DFF9C6|nr:hypothetical protein [Terriglobus albidus]
MTIERKALIVLSIVLAVLAVIAGRSIWVQHDELMKADQTVALRDQQIEVLKGAIASRDAADEDQQAAAHKAQAAVQTSTDAVKVITKLVTVPGAPVDVPQSVVAQKEEIADVVRERLPESPDYVVQTAAVAEETAKRLIQCEADRKSLQACKADKADLLDMFGLEKQNANMYQKVAKGGSVAKHTWDIAKCALVSGGGAWAAYSLGKDSRSAAIGGAAGAVACKFIF